MILKSRLVKNLSKKLRAKKFYNKGLKSANKPEKILFWSMGGMIIQTNLEALIATALKLRGHKPLMIICDGVYKACAKRVDIPGVPIEEWSKYCKSCIRQSSSLLDRLGIEYKFTSDLISKKKSEELRNKADKVTIENYKELTHNGLNHGSHLESAMTRHTRGGDFKGLENILREYAFAVLIVAETSEAAIKKFKPGKIYMSHGIYADWGPALSLAVKYKIPTTSYIGSYLTGHFYFGTVDSFNETFLNITKKTWENNRKLELTDLKKMRLSNFISNRYEKNITADMKGILKDYRGDKKYFMKKYSLDSEKPIWGVMTHINWDAVSDYFPMIHKNFDEWLYETLKEIINIKDVQWLIKIHPSELNDNPLTGCQKFIENNFPELPSHIKVIKMDDDISPHDFYSLLEGAVTVMGTGGLELSLQGKPVILAGKAHYSGKGFTYDAKNEKDYKELLRNAANLKSNDNEMKELALKYGYIHLIQRQIPLLPVIKEDLRIDFDKLESLYPGKNKFIDFICGRIIDGEDFVLPDVLVELNQIDEKEQIKKDI